MEETHKMEETKQPTDIFLWANHVDEVKKELDVEFFLFNKHYTPYLTNFSSDLDSQIKPLFLYDLINFINLGAGTGLSVCDFELSEAEDNVLLRADLAKVGRAETLLCQIETQRQDIVEFNEQEHDFKRIKGILARFTSKDSSIKPFYVIKQLSQGQVLKGSTAWEFRNGKFGTFSADAGLKVPSDNQVLITSSDIFVFNQAKFERLFDYDYKKQALADKKVAEIEKRFRLSFPEGMDLQSLVRERKKTVNKLQKVEIDEKITQEQVINYADEMQLDLMTDDNGSIIIMDGKDLDTFVNLIDEDYITSEITGQRFEIKSKRLLDDPEGEPPRGL
jgi:hypothetical protein